MTRNIIAFLLLLILMAGPATAAGPQEPPMKEAVLTVSGMFCASCAAVVGKVLREMNGVTQVRVDLRNDRATVRYDGRRVTPRQMAERVATLGYRVRSADRQAPAVQREGSAVPPR